VETNLSVDFWDTDPASGAGRMTGYGTTTEGVVVLEGEEGKRVRKTGRARDIGEPLLLDGEWEFQPEAANALVIGKWLAAQETPGTDRRLYATPDADTTSGWLPMVPGAWSFQLPAEPEAPYPVPVWYRARFALDYLPPKADLIVDGFAGSEWELYANGRRVDSRPVRSAIDSQMKAVDITPYLQLGENLVALRLVVTNPTDGLLDLLKIVGDFSLAPQGDGNYRIVAPPRTVRPKPWTEQGYPFYSGPAVYRQRFQLPESFLGQRVFLQPELRDDALEVLVNGQSAAVRLWPSYEVEVTPLLQSGENILELRVANTLVNLLEAVPRPSGLTGAPRLVPHRQFTFDLDLTEPDARRGT